MASPVAASAELLRHAGQLCLRSSIVVIIDEYQRIKGFFFSSRADAAPKPLSMIQLLTKLQQQTKPNLLLLGSGPDTKTSRDKCYIFSSFIEKCLF